MTGKVFPESQDIYQDQAQILFDYYRQAAERIVEEETHIEAQIAETETLRQEAAAEAEKTHKQFVGWASGAVVSLVALIIFPLFGLVGIPLCGVNAFRKNKASKAATEKTEQFSMTIEGLNRSKENIRRDYHVERVGVAYVPVAERVPSGDKSYLVDLTGEEPDTEFSLTLINSPDELKSAMDSLHDHMQEMPVVESNDNTETVDTSDYSTSVQDITLHDYMGTIDREVRRVRYLISDNRRISVSIPVVLPASQRHQMLDEFATDDTGDYPIVPVFETDQVHKQVKEFSSLGALNEQSSTDGSGDVDFFVDVMRRLAQGVDMLSSSRTASMTQLIGYTSKIFQNVLKASFNHYSPSLEAEEIERIRNTSFNYSDEVDDYVPFRLKESSRVRYDIFSDTWQADNGSRTAMPFGMHQVDAEVLMPVIENLMHENRLERLRIYSDIQSQKTDYLNQWHRDTDDFYGRNRTEANGLLQRMNEAYAEYVESYTNYQQQNATIQTMKASGNLEDAEVAEAQNQAEVIAGFQVRSSQARKKQAEFMEFMDRIREDIDQCAERFGHVEFYEASLRDYQARENARAVANVRELDPRRRWLASVSPYLAQEGNVPPEPNVSERLDEDFAINLGMQAEGQIQSIAARESNAR